MPVGKSLRPTDHALTCAAPSRYRLWPPPAVSPAAIGAQASPAQIQTATSQLEKVGEGRRSIAVGKPVLRNGQTKACLVRHIRSDPYQICQLNDNPKSVQSGSVPDQHRWWTPASPMLAAGWDTPPQTNDYDRSFPEQRAGRGGLGKWAFKPIGVGLLTVCYQTPVTTFFRPPAYFDSSPHFPLERLSGEHEISFSCSTRRACEILQRRDRALVGL